jgi:hypothetical protein
MRDPRPFAVFISGKFSFTVHARSLEQAQAIVAAKVAGEAIVVAKFPNCKAGLTIGTSR